MESHLAHNQKFPRSKLGDDISYFTLFYIEKGVFFICTFNYQLSTPPFPMTMTFPPTHTHTNTCKHMSDNTMHHMAGQICGGNCDQNWYFWWKVNKKNHKKKFQNHSFPMPLTHWPTFLCPQQHTHQTSSQAKHVQGRDQTRLFGGKWECEKLLCKVLVVGGGWELKKKGDFFESQDSHTTFVTSSRILPHHQRTVTDSWTKPVEDIATVRFGSGIGKILRTDLGLNMFEV